MAASSPKMAHASHTVRLERLFLVLLIASAFLFRFWGLSRMHFWDENVYLLNAEYIYSGHAGYTEIDSRPPLLSILFALAFNIWHSDYAAALVTALLNALGPAFLYLAGRRIFGRAAAAIAALLLAFGPFFTGIYQGQSGDLFTNGNGHSIMTDGPALTLIILSLLLLIRALEKQTILRFACAGFSLALPILMRFGSLSSMAMLSLMLLAANRRLRAILSGAAGFVLGMGPYLVWSRVYYGGFFETLRLGWVNLEGPAEPFFYYAKNAPVVFSWLAIVGLCLFLLREAYGFWVGKKELGAEPSSVFEQDQRRWKRFLLLWTLGVFIFFSSISHKEARYEIPLAAPLLLLAGCGLASLVEFKKNGWRIAGGLILFAALGANSWPIYHRFDTGFFDHSISQEMVVSDYLKQNFPASTILYTNVNYPDFAYYTNMKVLALPETGEALYERISKLPSDGILIAYKIDDSGNDAEVEPQISYLDANRHFTRIREFPTLILYQYRAWTE